MTPRAPPAVHHLHTTPGLVCSRCGTVCSPQTRKGTEKEGRGVEIVG